MKKNKKIILKTINPNLFEIKLNLFEKIYFTRIDDAIDYAKNNHYELFIQFNELLFVYCHDAMSTFLG